MVVCKFFQEGYCRYGQNCRFEHVYGSKYSYHANNPAPQPQKQVTGGVTDEQLVQQVHNDVQSALKGGQWLLSCYAPFKKPNFPGLTDLSAEEARLFIYEAKSNNTIDQAIAYMTNLTKEARTKYEQLLTTSPNMVQTLRSLYNGENVSSPFSAQTPQNVFGQSQTNASSVFRSAIQSSSQSSSPFGQSNSVFGQSPNVFGQQDSAKSLFSQASQNVFGSPPAQTQNVFGSPPAQTQNVFGSPPAQTQNVFGSPPAQSQSVFGAQATQSQNVFGAQPAQQNVFGQPGQQSANQNTAQSIFGQANSSADPAKSLFAQATGKSPFGSQTSTPFKSPFEQPSPFAQNNAFQTSNAGSVFGQATNVFQQTPADDPSVYSNINEISAEDLEMFKADSFKLGFIPEIPPPHSLCV